MTDRLNFIDLFAGIGGMRQGLEDACQKMGISAKCVFTSEIKEHAIATYQKNFSEHKIHGDISQISTTEIPDFDILLAGFPCQPFSTAGTRQGFLDTRGTLFFEIERILEAKQPFGFLLENVEGLVKHDRGRTLATILNKLDQLDYHVTWKVLNAKNFGIPQDRKRIYIAGNKSYPISLEFSSQKKVLLKNIFETGKPVLKTDLTQRLLAHYSIEELYGKAIKDKRGGHDNIHSWDLELKGKISQAQKELLNQLLKERRKKYGQKQKVLTGWMECL
jgi:DNA (cytosine-5)-methyltransferase 1